MNWNKMNNKSKLIKKVALSSSEINKLLKLIEETANGKYSYDIMDYTSPAYSRVVRKIAEAIGLMMVKIEAKEMHLKDVIKELEEVNAKLKKNIIHTVLAIADSVEARDAYTADHAKRVADLCKKIAVEMGLPKEEVENIKIAGRLHDLGKLGFSDKIFQNEDPTLPADLTDEMKKHPELGASILKKLDVLDPILDYVRFHHERIDGGGYPKGLKGDMIPLGAKIIAVADCYDAITSDRPYQKGRSPAKAIKILKEMSGTKLDKEATDALVRIIEKKRKKQKN
jgi:putative nucleotidyltransferase with HDIG domain